MNEKELIEYYNKFKEDKRLDTKHGQVEFLTAIKYINKYLNKDYKILDVGAGTGKYSIYYKKLGYDVTAVELVKQNINTFKSNLDDLDIPIYQGNAINLSMFKDNTFDIVLLFGPMYHLISQEEKISALKEAKRIVKNNGYIFISYCMNEYAIITHGFKENYIKEDIKSIDNKYNIISKDNDLYSFVRIKDINKLNKICNLKRVKIIAQDGPTEYIKKEINKMDEETFNIYLNYHFKTCESKYLLEASRHTLDILKKV